jgi:hypothetical protein
MDLEWCEGELARVTAKRDEIEEPARTALLASERATCITGRSMAADGGRIRLLV